MTDTVDKVVIQSETQGVQQSADQLNQLGKSMDGVTVASQNVEKSTGSVDSKFASLERRFQTTAGQATQFERIQRTVNDAVAKNPDLQGRANEILAAAEARYLSSGAAVKELATAHAGLDAQGQAALHSIRSFGEQIALGIPITQAATGQLNHLSFAASGEGGLASAFGQVGGIIGGVATKIASFVTPAGIVAGSMAALAAGAVAAGVAWQESQNNIEKALAGIGRQSGVTVSDINAVASATAASSKLSIGQATDLATAFAATGKISKDVLGPATAATDGLAKAMGVDASEAAKVLAGALADPAKGVSELDAKVGAFNATTREQIAQALRMGDTAQAQALIINGVAVATQGAIEANKSWADSFTYVWKSIKDGANLLGKDLVQGAQLAAHDIGGAPASSGFSKQEQLSVAKSDLASFQQSLPGNLAANAGDTQAIQAIYDAYAKLLDQVNKLKEAANSESLAGWNNELAKAANAATEATRALVPQIDQVHKLEGAISDLTRAQNVTSVGGPFSQDYGAALTAAQNQLQLAKESKDEAARYNTAVQQIGQAWGDVSLKTALQLQSLQNQLPVISAITNSARMEAQYYATINQLQAQGKSITDATAIAHQQYVNSLAQVSASTQQQTQSIQDQNQLFQAGIGLQGEAQLRAQERVATEQAYNDIIKQEGDNERGRADAAARAGAIEEQYRLRILAIRKQEEASAQAALDKALNANFDQATLLNAGADAALLLKSGAGFGNGPGAPNNGGTSIPDVMTQSGSFAGGLNPNAGAKASFGGGGAMDFSSLQLNRFGSGSAQDAQNRALMSGGAQIINQTLASQGLDAAIAAAMSIATTTNPYAAAGNGANGGFDSQAQGGFSSNKATAADLGAVISNLQELFNLKNSGADKATQLSNDQEFLSWLQAQPMTLNTLQAIASLKDSINNLTGSTDGLNNTMSDLLSPYYAQDPRTSHIGYRSQGMAMGGFIDIPGPPSANDNMTLTVPVAGGERFYVDPQLAKRGMSGAGTTNNNITVSPTVVVQGNADQAAIDGIGRTVYQAAQAAVRQLGASTR